MYNKRYNIISSHNFIRNSNML